MEAIITVIIVLLVCIVIWYISTSNGIKRSQLKVEEAESGIDVALTKRYDVLTKMLDVVKGYQAHEKTVLTEASKRHDDGREECSQSEDGTAYKGYQHSRRELSGVKIQQQLHGVAEDDCRCGRAFAGSPQIVQCKCQHVQYEACCISEQHRSKQHACGKETILRGRGSKASGCEDELLIKIKILKQKSGAFMQMNSPDFLWQRLSNARIMRCI